MTRIKELEQITHHDVIAFTRAVSETLTDEKRWVHYLLTSTDVVDTSNGIIYKEANTIIKSRIEEMLSTFHSEILNNTTPPSLTKVLFLAFSNVSNV